MKNYLCFIAIAVTAIFFLISVFLLTRKKAAAGDDVNVYGVDKKTKKDKYYIKLYIRLIIISFVSVVISALFFLISGYIDAKKKYDAFNDKKFLEALDGNALDCSLSEFVEDNIFDYRNSGYTGLSVNEIVGSESYITTNKDGKTMDTREGFIKRASENLTKRLSDFKEEIKGKKVMDYFDVYGTLYMFEGSTHSYDKWARKKYDSFNMTTDEYFFAKYLSELERKGILDYDTFKFPATWTCFVEDLLFPCIFPFGFALLFILYMFPTKIARQKCHEQTAAIAWVNGILGWTIVGYVAMLIWANSSGKENEPVRADAADRFRQLEELKLKGVITEKEYEEQKSKILQEL